MNSFILYTIIHAIYGQLIFYHILLHSYLSKRKIFMELIIYLFICLFASNETQFFFFSRKTNNYLKSNYISLTIGSW